LKIIIIFESYQLHDVAIVSPKKDISSLNSTFHTLAQDDSLWRNFCISWGLMQKEGIVVDSNNTLSITSPKGGPRNLVEGTAEKGCAK